MYNTLSTSEAAFAGGLLGSMVVVAIIFSLVMSVLMIIAEWKVLEKAGEKGWKALIPIYNAYMLYKIVGMEKWFLAIIITSFLISFMPAFLSQGTQSQDVITLTGVDIFVILLMVAVSIFSLVITVMHSARLSKAFGHGTLFTLGLVFFCEIFLLILGFDGSKYDKKLVKSWVKKTA